MIIAVMVFSPLIHLSANAQSYRIPIWVRHNAQWWANSLIGDKDYVSGIQYLINQNIIIIPITQSAGSSKQVIPIWIKNDAGWWANGQVSDGEYVKGLQYMISNGIMSIGSSQITSQCPSGQIFNSTLNECTSPAPPIPPQTPPPVPPQTPPPAQSTTSTSGGKLEINIFPTNPSSVMSVIQSHNLGSSDYAASFNPSLITQFPNMNKILVAASLSGINNAINVAKSNPSYGIEYIAYDNEHQNSPSTPSSEQADPVGSTNQAATLVRSAGYKFGIAPDSSFLMSEYQGVNWSNIDMVVMQVQRTISNNPSQAQSDISSVSQFAKAHNPNVKVLAQVNPSLADPSTIGSIINNNKNMIDGVSIICGGATSASLLDATLTALGR